MKNKSFIVTGASQGIGRETALELANMGAEVVLISRDPKRGVEARQEIIQKSRNSRVYLETADLSSLSEIRHLAERLTVRFPLISGLINNHAALFPTYTLSVDNIEMNFALNHLSYFMLTLLLRENIEHAHGRIVNVAARVHTNIEQDFLTQPATPETYNPWDAYCQAKLANILFTYALARRLSGTPVTVNCLHPGTAQTRALKAAREIYSSLHGLSEYPPAGTLETAAATSLYLATSPEVEGVSGKYFIDCQPVPSSDLSYDLALQEKLWEISSALTKIEQRVVKSDMKRM